MSITKNSGTLGGKTLIVFTAKIFETGLGFISQVVLGRFLGPAAFGLYGLGMSLQQLLVRFSLLGLGNGAMRYIPSYQAQNDQASVKGTIYSAGFISICCAVFIGVISWFAAPWLAVTLFNKPDFLSPFRLFAVILPFAALFDLSGSMLVGFSRSGPYAWTKVLRTILHLTLAVSVFLLGFRLGGAIAAMGCAFALILLGNIILIKRGLPGRDVRPTYHLREVLRFSVPLLFSGVMYMLILRTDMIMLGVFVESRELGIYRAAVSFAAFVGFALFSIEPVVSSAFSKLFRQGRFCELKGLYNRANRVAFIGSLIFAFEIILFARELLGLFGPAFHEGWPVLLILAVGQLVSVSVGPMGILLQMTGCQDFIFRMNFFTALLNVLLNYLLISKLAMIGAAIATLCSMVFRNGMGVLHLWRQQKISPLHGHLGSAVIMVVWAALCLLASYLNFKAFWLRGLIANIALAVGLFGYGKLFNISTGADFLLSVADFRFSEIGVGQEKAGGK